MTGKCFRGFGVLNSRIRHLQQKATNPVISGGELYRRVGVGGRLLCGTEPHN